VDYVESQLFARQGLYSAVRPKKGLFEVADQGTIFFDKIATISPETQASCARDSGTRIHAAGARTDEGGCANCRSVEYRAANLSRRAIARLYHR